MSNTADKVSMKYVLNKKVNSKKYIESLLNDSEEDDDGHTFNEDAEHADYSRNADLSGVSPVDTSITGSPAVGNSNNSSFNSGSSSHAGQSGHAVTASRGHLRNDSTGSSYSYKKKEGVSNSIKALQDKIKKGLDLNEPEESVRSPPLSVKSYRSNFEKSIKSPPPARSVENSPRLTGPIKTKPQETTASATVPHRRPPPASARSNSFANSNHSNDSTYNHGDTSYDSINPFSPNVLEDRSFNTSYNSQHNNSTTTTVRTSLISTTNNAYKNQTDYTNPKSPLSPVTALKKKHAIPQFKVVRKVPSSDSNASRITTPKSPTGSITSVEIQKNHELKQLQLIDREISKKIKKIQAEIKFIEDSLPPNPCIHDFQSRKKLAAAKATLEKNLEFWEKKKYENGISFSKLSRKVVYSGGEEVTTFFSGRNE